MHALREESVTIAQHKRLIYWKRLINLHDEARCLCSVCKPMQSNVEVEIISKKPRRSE
jgi:hypothetical protein